MLKISTYTIHVSISQLNVAVKYVAVQFQLQLVFIDLKNTKTIRKKILFSPSAINSV